MNTSAEIERCYEELVHEAVSAAPENAVKIWVRSEIFDSVSITGLYYLSKKHEHHAAFDHLCDVDDALNRLHSAIKESGDTPFSAATLTIEKQKKSFFSRQKVSFSINYSYADVSNLSFMQEREDAWIKAHLGSNIELKYD